MRTVLTILAFAAVFSVGAMGGGAVRAEDRLALVIGNSDYAIGPLANPVNDAGLMARSLTEAGFDVTQASDLGYRDMQRAVVHFARRLAASGPDTVGMVYYAGHAVQAEGENYLIPVDADIQDALDLEIQSLKIDTVMRSLESAGNRLNLVVLDACRNNPFPAVSRSGMRGLARVDAPYGTLLAYSTAPGEVAADGTDRNSPYTAALARTLRTPGLPVEQVFKQVRISVMERTGNRQVPWESSSLTGDFYFFPPAEPAPPIMAAAAPAVSAEPDRSAEIAFWNSVADSGDKVQLESYLQAFPDGLYAPLASAKIAALGQAPAVAAAPAAPPAPAAAPSHPYDGTWRFTWEVESGFAHSDWCRAGESGSQDLSIRNGRFKGDMRSEKGGRADLKIQISDGGSATVETYIGSWGYYPRRRTVLNVGDGSGWGSISAPSGNSCIARMELVRLSE
ncbi:caspase family protein [Pacificispira sp.]|uniref:caspase family protein n=1 Tax=Pacificispira sp. TaxID=2888761 RepID=UPI003BA982E8